MYRDGGITAVRAAWPFGKRGRLGGTAVREAWSFLRGRRGRVRGTTARDWHGRRHAASAFGSAPLRAARAYILQVGGGEARDAQLVDGVAEGLEVLCCERALAQLLG